jgi:site-specific DNA recombinase
MSLRAAIYARVSTDIQRDNFSIPSQIDEILRFAKIRNLSIVGDRYVSPETGKDIAKVGGAIPAFVDDYTSTELSRPSLDVALSFLEKTGFDILLVHAIDRLARDPYFRQTIEREFLARGARVEYILGNYDQSPEGEVRKDLDATFAKWENAKRVERMNRGKKRKAQMGKFVTGKMTYGYRSDPNAFANMAVYVPEAEVVQMVFGWFVENRLSLKQIALELNRLGVKSYHNHNVWSTSSIARMLKNPAYAGYFYYNKHKTHNKKIIKRDFSEWIKIECTPLISKELFEAAQEILHYNKEYVRKHPKRFYLLSTIIFCSDCGRPYLCQTRKAPHNRTKNDEVAYRHRIRQGHCSNRWISAKKLEPIVWEGVVNILLNPQSLREGYEQTMEREKEKQARQIQHIETLQSAIEKLQAKRGRLQKMYLDPDMGMTKEDYLEEKRILDVQINNASLDLEKLASELQRIPSESDLQSLEQMASKIVSGLGNNLDIPPEDKRRVMQMLNLKVLISSDGMIKLEGWFTPESDGFSSTSLEHYARQLPQLRERA